MNGRPALRERAEQQRALRLDPDVLARFSEDDPRWQGRINGCHIHFLQKMNIFAFT